MERSTFELGLIAPNKRWLKVHVPIRRSLHNVTALNNDLVLQARGFCTDYLLPVSSCPLRWIFFIFALYWSGVPLYIYIFLACNHVTRRPCWWCVGGQYNIIFSRRIYMKIGFSFQRKEMLLFLTLTHHQHGRPDVTCKPAIDKNQEIIIGQILWFGLIFILLFSFVSNSLS